MRKKVLLVEDDPSESFVDILEEFENCEVTIAETVSEALRLLYERQFSAIIMDIIVPAGEGYEKYFSLSADTRGCPGFKLARMIKEGYFGKIPTIILSGLVSSFRLRGRISQLRNDHIFAIAKPEVDEVFEMLSRIT